jgi:uncharacterized membrane protein
MNKDKSQAEAHDQVNQNIESILAFCKREEEKLSHPQRIIEYVSNYVGSAHFLGTALLFVALWILVNVMAEASGKPWIDPAPFGLLHVILTLCALITATVVLIQQNRLAKIEEQRAHLDLQVNLLTEQKTTKLIQLIEELRQDLPMVKNRNDPEADALQQPTDPSQVLSALDEWQETNEPASGIILPDRPVSP